MEPYLIFQFTAENRLLSQAMIAEEQITSADAKYIIPNLFRGMRVLEVLARHPEGISQSDLAASLEVPANSVYRIVVTLEHLGYVLRDSESRSVVLTRKLLGLAHLGRQETSIVEASLPEMRRLRDRTGETTVLNVMHGHESVVMEQVAGTHAFRFVIEPGLRSEVHFSAHGKAMTAFLREEKAEAVIEKTSFHAYTPRTINSPDAFRRELEEVRRVGYALDREEGEEGVRCVSAPIFDHANRVAGAMTITGPTSRLRDADLPELGPIVREHAARISQSLGCLTHGEVPPPHLKTKKKRVG